MKIRLDCESKIAYDSPDHINPLGTKQDNSRNRFFNEKIYRLYSQVSMKEQLKILDLGCSGGGFVNDCHNDGCFAIGLEGSDYSEDMRRAAWGTIPYNLFTCDITKRFSLYKNDKNVKFNIITAWEVLEHLDIKGVYGLINNIKKNISKNGIFVASIENKSCKYNGQELHQTQKPKEWWISEFKRQGLIYRPDIEEYFNRHYVRGRAESNESFHIVFCINNNKVPKIPVVEKRLDRILDSWYSSKLLYRILKVFYPIEMRG